MRKFFLGFAAHTFIALPVGGVICVLIAGAAERYLDGVRDTTLTRIFDWYLPYVVIVGLILGFVVNRKSLTVAACYVWISGIIWLTLGIFDSIHGYDARYYQGCSAFDNVVNAFFVLDGRKCGGGASTLAGIFFTIPVLCSIFYSAGAWLALRFAKEYA